MRFGIMSMQMSRLVPPSPEPEKVMTHISQFKLVNLLKELHSSGFNLIEIGGDLVLFMPHCFTPASIQEIVEFKEESLISFSVHLPLWSVEPSTLLTPVRQGSVRAVIDMIRATLPLKPETYVLHATGALAAEFYQMRLPEAAKAAILRQFQHNARESIKTILAETGIPSRLLAIETIEFPFNLTFEIAEEFNLSMCLDTGHVLVGFSGPVGLFDVLEKCLPRLGEIHFHDGPWQGPERKIGYGKDHQPLGSGDLDVPRFLDRLESAKYNGPIIFELTVEQAVSSYDYVRSIRPDLITK